MKQNHDYRKTNFWQTLLLILAGVVVGSLVSELTKEIPVLKWFSYGLFFGTENPFTLHLAVFDITFGIGIKLTLSVILFVTASILIGRKIFK